MSRWGSILTAGLLVVVLALLAVPFGLYIGPALTDTSAGVDNAPAPKVQETPTTKQVPQAQQAPESVSKMTSVGTLEGAAPVPDPDILAKRLDSALVTKGQGGFTGVVTDAVTGKVLYNDGGKKPRVPASNTKLLTAVTVLEAFKADHRFTTRVVRGKNPKEIVLVGGGDVLLGPGESKPEKVMGHAGLQSLAAETVSALKKAGVQGKVKVRFDDSLFPKWQDIPWQEGDLEAGQVAPIFPMAMHSGRFSPEDRHGERPQDSALLAAKAFAKALDEAGADADLSSTPVSRAEVAAKAAELASVESATVAEQVQLMLETSDNFLAESLSRMAAHAQDRAATFSGSTRNIITTLSELGINTESLKLGDSSGLSSANRISTAQVAAVLRFLVNSDDPDLAAVREGLPVAGLTGTLEDRYKWDAQEGAGLVRAKTGTLNNVLALSGYVVTAQGRLLVFSFIGNNLGSIKLANEVALDEAAAVLANCGCR